MSNGSFKLGRMFGIKVNAHWSVALIAVYVGRSLTTQFGMVAGSAAVVAFLVSILTHELSHALTARRYGVTTESIQLWALGGIARLSSEPSTAKAEGWIAAAGPIASAALAVACLSSWRILSGPFPQSDTVEMIAWLGVINASLAVFNLLPGAPLDGGRILRAVRWSIHGDRYRSAREAGSAGIYIGYALSCGGLALILMNDSGVWLVVTGLFIAANAKGEVKSAVVREALVGVKIRDLTWFGVANANGELDADSILWDRSRLGQAGGVAVVDASGNLAGLVLEEQLWAVPAEDRAEVLLAQLMVPFDRIAMAGPDESLAEVLPRVNPAKPAIAVWFEGRLVGLVSSRRLRDCVSAVRH